MRSDIFFRDIVADDEKFLFTLYASSRQAELNQCGWDETQQHAFLQMQFRMQQRHYQNYPNLCHEIICNNDSAIGRMLTSWMDSEIRLVDITLLPAFQQQGVGTFALQKLLAAANHKNLAVTLHVTVDNPALRLYQRLGFQVIEEKLPYVFMQSSIK